MRRTSAVLLALSLAATVVGVAPVVATVGSPWFAGSSAIQADDPRPPVERWNRTYDSPGEEIFSSITQTPDGYLLTGWTDREGSDDGWVLAVDSDGRVRWSVVVGGNGVDRLYDATQTADGGYLLAGRTDRDGEPRGWLVKVDGGRVEWQRTVASRPGGFRAVERTGTDVLVGGWTWDDATAGWLVTLDGRGEVVRERTFHSGDDARTRVKALVADEQGVLLVGTSETDEDHDGWAARLDDGVLAWSRTYGDDAHDDVWAAAAADSGYVLAGETGTEERAGRDAWVLALDANGTVRWERTFGEAGHDWFDSASATDEGVLVTGGTGTGGIGGTDGFVVLIDDAGAERWRTVVGTPLWDKPWPAVVTDDGYLLAGHSSGYDTDGTAGWLVRLDADTTATTATVVAGTSASDPPADRTTTPSRRTTTEGDAPGSFWRPGLAALAAVAALALGVLVARR